MDFASNVKIIKNPIIQTQRVTMTRENTGCRKKRFNGEKKIPDWSNDNRKKRTTQTGRIQNIKGDAEKNLTVTKPSG